MEEQFKAIGDTMHRAQNGDTAAYKQGLQMVLPFLRRYAQGQMRKYGRDDQAEDAVQEALMAVHMKLHTWEPDKPFMNWVYTITRYKIVDILRRSRVQDVSIDEPEHMAHGAVNDAPAAEARMDLDDLLSSLDPPQGEIIRALKIEGQTVAHVANEYGYTESKVKVMVHRAIKKLGEIAAETRVS